jgi:hypothetical protein
MPRLVRRKPLLERIQDYLNPADFLLWLSEEIETRDWDPKSLGTPLAFFLHLLLIIAKSNARAGVSSADDVFGDVSSGSGWLGYIVSRQSIVKKRTLLTLQQATFIYHFLTYFSIGNAIYTFARKRNYRLFESNVETPQSTPSARRVRVDSSPVASSPLRFLTSILGDTSAESRAHPDPTRDVWELAVWDPLPLCLRIFCFFSPGHVLVYWLFLPTLPSDPRPSITVFTTLLLQILMSSQLYLLQSNFSQQEKDSAIIHKEVMSEYDIKYVHPRLNPLVRDVGTQYYGPASETQEEEVDTYTPTVILKRGFHPHPNPNYAKHIDPNNIAGISSRGFSPAPSMPTYTPSAYNSREPTPFSGMTPRTAIRQPQFRQSTSGATSTGTSIGDGGSLGVYSHSNSPLKKTTSLYDMHAAAAPENSLDMASREAQDFRERSKSPTKRQSDIHQPLFSRNRVPFTDIDDGRRTSSPGVFGSTKPKLGSFDGRHSRGPSRF